MKSLTYNYPFNRYYVTKDPQGEVRNFCKLIIEFTEYTFYLVKEISSSSEINPDTHYPQPNNL